jgi:hypothetical protein
MVTPTRDANNDGTYITSEVGHVNGVLSIGSNQYDWQALPYKIETTINTTTNIISWETVNPYGNNVRLDIVSAPASEILVTKHVGRIGGYGHQSEVYNPVVYLRNPPATSLYRVTALLSRYSNETVIPAEEIPVQGNGNALRVHSSSYDDFIYTGNGNSSFNSFSTDANVFFVRRCNDTWEITLLHGSFFGYQNEQWVSLSKKADYVTMKKTGNSIDYLIGNEQEPCGLLCPNHTIVEKNFTVRGYAKNINAFKWFYKYFDRGISYNYHNILSNEKIGLPIEKI